MPLSAFARSKNSAFENSTAEAHQKIDKKACLQIEARYYDEWQGAMPHEARARIKF